MMYNSKPLFVEYDLKDYTSRRTFGLGKDIFKNGQVISLSLQGTTITGDVKEDDIYHTRIQINKGKITTLCSCHNNWEPVCKHAVALGIAYLNKVNEINANTQKTTNQSINNKPIPQENLFINSLISTINAYSIHGGKMAFILHIDSSKKNFSISFYDQATKEVIQDPQWYLTEKSTEKSILQTERNFIEYFIQLETIKFFMPSRYYPIEKYLYLIPLMFPGLVFFDLDTSTQYIFSNEPLDLSVQISLTGNLELQPSWFNKTTSFSIHKALHIKGIKSYVLYDYTFFPLLNDFTKDIAFKLLYNKKLEFGESDIPRVLLDIIPALEQNGITIERDKSLSKVSVVTAAPQPVLELKSMQDHLQARLFFNYQDNLLESSINLADKYFCYQDRDMVFIKRDIPKEHEYNQFLIKSGFEFAGNNAYQAEREKALDFVNKILPGLRKEWKIITDELKFHTINKERICLDIDCAYKQGEPDFFLTFCLKLGLIEISYKKIKKDISERNKYYLLEDNSYAEVCLDDLNALLTNLKKLNAEKISDMEYKLPLYQGYHIYKEFSANITATKDFETFIKGLINFQQIPSLPVPKSLDNIMRKYQKAGYEWMYFLKGNFLSGILADDMGLGKTIQALALLQKEYVEDKTKLKSLVIVPTSTIFNWENEFRKFAPSIKVCVYTGNNRKLKDISKHDVVLTSYAIMRKDIDILVNEQFHYCILDEAQYIKNFRSQTSKSVKKIQALYRLALTGTPIENNLSELWAIFDFLMPKFLFSFEFFKNNYIIPIEQEQSYDLLMALQKKINPFVLRRLKENVAKELPPKIENYLYCELHEAQHTIYAEYVNKIKNNIYSLIKNDGLAKNHLHILAGLTRLRQICCHPALIDPAYLEVPEISAKFDYMKDIVSEIISEKHKILIFSQFVEMLDIIKAWFVMENISFEYLTGAVKDRQKVVNNFNENPAVQVFLISLKTGGVGINLTAADYVIHYDPWWNPAVENQATDRTHRIGQDKKIFSYKMITKDTIEERILKLQEKKKILVNSVITSEIGLSKSITKDDLDFLLSF